MKWQHDGPMRIRIVGLVLILCAAIAGDAQQVDHALLTARVRTELLTSWRAYEQYAWGRDELRPISKTRVTGTANRC